MATITQILALSERAAHTLLESATATRPVLADAPDAEDGFGRVAVAGTCGAGINGNEGIPDQVASRAWLDPARRLCEKLQQFRKDGGNFFGAGQPVHQECHADGRLGDALT